VSRLTELIAQVAKADAALADDLRREVGVLSSRRPFGLNFERHVPESVELPSRKIRRGDKAIFRSAGRSDRQPWIVVGFEGSGVDRKSQLVRRAPSGKQEATTAAPSELIVVVEFRDPIYPGLRSTGVVERGGGKPFHGVISGENYHVLQALTFVCRGQVDCIYLDPPYNSGARDWKYNNDYVESEDAYRHSKWLAMMERRLLLAKELLNPDDSVLIVTIDEKEYLRLGLLLEQIFPGCNIQMTSIVINPKGTARYNEFSRVEEYAFFVFIGSVKLQATGSDMLTDRDYASESDVRWRGLARTGRKGLRSNNPGSWYPIFLRKSDWSIHSVGDAIPLGEDDAAVTTPRGTVAVWPPTKDGRQYSWSTVPETLRHIHARGGLKTGRVNPDKSAYPFYYLSAGSFEKIDSGEMIVTGRGDQGELIVEFAEGAKSAAPRTVWNQVAHDAGSHGTVLLQRLIPGRKFPFPKSLFAVEDCLRFFVKDKPEALIIDFFAGSGTTAHAVMRLNRQDAGRRRSILVTNNEVSAEEAVELRSNGFAPGDPEWEALGIFEHIAKPRIMAAITGRTPGGERIEGDYRFADTFPMAEGFEENVEFFNLTYEDPDRVRYGLGFEAIAPLLWLRAGSEGNRVNAVEERFAVVDTYAVLFDLDGAAGFVAAVRVQPSLRVAYVVTDDETQFQVVAGQLPRGVESVRLYASYLDNFRVQAGV
jgi:adenine-specific DNA-methyltransferase